MTDQAVNPRSGHSRAVPLTRRLLNDIGISYRQFDYWCTNGTVPVESRGSGHFRVLTDDEEASLRAMAALVNAGMTPRAAARIAFDGSTDDAMRLRTALDEAMNHE